MCSRWIVVKSCKGDAASAPRGRMHLAGRHHAGRFMSFGIGDDDMLVFKDMKRAFHE